MQMLMLIALGLVTGTALIAGVIAMALHPPAIFRRQILADAIDRPDHALADAVMYSCATEDGSSHP